MEFHNVKLLPKGLPEIIAQLVPYEDAPIEVPPEQMRLPF